MYALRRLLCGMHIGFSDPQHCVFSSNFTNLVRKRNNCNSDDDDKTQICIEIYTQEICMPVPVAFNVYMFVYRFYFYFFFFSSFTCESKTKWRMECICEQTTGKKLEMKIEMKQRITRKENNRMIARIWTNSRWEEKTKRKEKEAHSTKNRIPEWKKWDKAHENPHRFIFCVEMVVVLCWHDRSIHQDKKNENKILLKI